MRKPDIRVLVPLLFLAPLLSAQSVNVSPSNQTVPVGATQQFTAKVEGLMDTAVSWSVNGKAGGSATYGTITATGLYAAPTTAPVNNYIYDSSRERF